MSDVAACCADFYEQDWVTALMGPSFHPGGLDSSRRLARAVNLSAGDRVLDVASGTGATARMMAEEFGCDVVGLDVSEVNAKRASELATELSVEFQVGDAAALPFEDASFDAVICECAVSTFENKPAVASEFSRVLRRGGRLGLTDMCCYGELPERLASVAGPWACLQDALTVEGYQKLFLEAGLRATACEDESASLLEMALDFKRKLVLVGLGQMAGALAELGLDVPGARSLINEARDAVRAGSIQYYQLTFSRGPARVAPSCDPSTGCC